MKIAFCFLTYNDIVNSDLWALYLKNHLDKINIYIHSKNQLKHPFFKKYKTLKTIPTLNKTHISIVYATLSLLNEAYSNNDNTHFLFICQSCVPLMPFNKLFNIITNSKKSFIKKFENNCIQRYFQLSLEFKKEYFPNEFIKQHPNMMLIRNHVKFLLNNTNLLKCFKNMICPDEHYFINILKFYGFLDTIEDIQITFCNFNINRTQGLLHRNININIIKKLSKKYLFIRKIDFNSFVNYNKILYYLIHQKRINNELKKHDLVES